MENACCLLKDNQFLKNIIQDQTFTIGRLIQEKNDIKKQYENFILSVTNETTHILDNTSNIIDTSNIIIENSSNVI